MRARLLKTTALGTGPTKPGSPSQMMIGWTAKTVEKEQVMTKQIKRVHVTWMDKVAIGQFLSDDQVLLKRSDGTCSYLGDRSDKSVAEVMTVALGKPVTEHNVAAVRKDRYGVLAVLVAPKQLTIREQLQNLSALLERVCDRVDHLEARVRELEG